MISANLHVPVRRNDDEFEKHLAHDLTQGHGDGAAAGSTSSERRDGDSKPREEGAPEQCHSTHKEHRRGRKHSAPRT